MKCCVSVRECSAGRKCSTSGCSPMARWSSSPGGIWLGRCSVTPATSGAFCARQTSPKSWSLGESTGKCTRIFPSFCRPRPRSEKSFSKRQPDHSGVGIYAAVYPVAAGGKAGASSHRPAKWNTEKPHHRPGGVPISRPLLCGTSLDSRAGWMKMNSPSKPLASG